MLNCFSSIRGTGERKSGSVRLMGLSVAMAVWVSGCTSMKEQEQADTPAPAKPAIQTLAEINTPLTTQPLNIQKWFTPNGAEVLFYHAPELPMLDVRLVWDAGSARDGERPGLAQLTNSMIFEGSSRYNVDQLAQQFESVGARFKSSSYRDMAVVELRSMTKPEWLNTSLSTLSDVLHQPAFPKTNFERNRSLMLLGLEQQKEQPQALAGLELNKLLYGKHPYGIPSDGTSESLKAITLQDVKNFYQRFYVAKNMTIAMVGNLSRVEAERIAAQLSQGMPAGQPAPALPKPTLAQPGKHETLSHPSTQAHLLMATLGLSRDDEDEYYPLFVGNEILGGSGFSSLLNEEIRQKRGLSYSVGSGFTPMRQTGTFAISLQTKADQVAEAEKVVQQTLAQFLRDGPTAEQVENAKRNIVNSFPISVANNSGVVGYLGAMGFYDMPLDYLDNYLKRIQAVTPEQIKTVFNNRIKPNEMITVIVGP